MRASGFLEDERKYDIQATARDETCQTCRTPRRLYRHVRIPSRGGVWAGERVSSKTVYLPANQKTKNTILRRTVMSGRTPLPTFEGESAGGGEVVLDRRDVLDLIHGGGSRMTVDPRMPLQCRDGTCRVFTYQADIACTKREAP